MKEIYFYYSDVSDIYYLDFGRNGSQRENLGKPSDKKLINILERKIDVKRNSVFYLGNEVSAGLAEKIFGLFYETKVQVRTLESQ